jgi:hypothetical protein
MVPLYPGAMQPVCMAKNKIIATRKAGIRYYVSKRICKKNFGKGG